MAITLILLLSLMPTTVADNTNENLVSPESTTYSYEEYIGYFVAPDRAFNGNTSSNNYSRIITSCLYYVGNLACEDGEYFIDAVYTISFQSDVEYVNVSTISKTGYLSYGDPWNLELSISAIHKNGTDVLWSDNATPGYINTSSYEVNNTGPIPVRDNNTISLLFSIRTNPFWVDERDVEIRLNHISATKVVWGCFDPAANNYSPNATDSDDSCDYDLDDDGVLDADEVPGCTDTSANNFDSLATDDDGSCDYDLDDDGVLDANEVQGCTDPVANNFQANATDEDGSCDYDLDDDGVLDINEVIGCTDSSANNYQSNATDDDGSCDYDLDNDGVLDADEVSGCTDISANNFNPNATDTDESCDYDMDNDGVLDVDEIDGCTDQLANNFNLTATEDDGSCDYDLDNDGVMDASDIYPNCDDLGKDIDEDGLSDACEDFPNDKDNDGYSDSHEEHCESSLEDPNATPDYPNKYCADKLGVVDLYNYCKEDGLTMKCINLASKHLEWWNYVGLMTFIGIPLAFFTPLRPWIMSIFRKKELTTIERIHGETREYIETEFNKFEQKFLGTMKHSPDKQSVDLLEKIDLELGILSYELKKYIDKKHAKDLLNEKIPGDPRILLREHVDESKENAKNQLIKAISSDEEE